MVIRKQSLPCLLDRLAESREVIAPVAHDGRVLFEPIASGAEAAVEHPLSTLPPKTAYFPLSEVLFQYEDGVVRDGAQPGPRLLFGVRPCDARGFALLDKVFGEKGSEDPYYVAKRRQTVVIGLGCNTPLSTCFCSATGGGPFSVEGLDVLLTDLGEEYLAEALTAAGRELLAGDETLTEASGEHLSRKQSLVARAEAQSRPALAVPGLSEKLGAMYDDQVWSAIQASCLGCAACAYVCPTCHCFDIVDEERGQRGQRLRTWDCCQFSLFTAHASGHNPRPSGKERMRQRIMHKFRYFPERYDVIGCVGCGRCVRACPVNLDIRAVLERIGR
jgi:ferredoxin